MKWVTRERPKIDRIACPWLIARFIDKAAEFIYAPPDQVEHLVVQCGAIPYDIPGVELGHNGELCSFDALLRKYNLTDPALLSLARIVRAADTNRFDQAPEAMGLFAISSGLGHNIKNDHDLLRQGMVIYDALYAWCRSNVGQA
jgi:hypothetical protein